MPPGLTFNIYGNDVSASSTVRRVEGEVGGSADRIGGKFKSIGSTIAKGVAAAGALDFLKDSFAEAEEAQKVGAQTAAVIKSTGEAAHVSADQVSEYAGSLSEKVGIDDEAIQSGQNMLLTFTDIRNEVGRGNDIFNQATSIMTDMSVATGQSMTGAATMLGKALNDPVAGVSKLTKIGVTFTDQQKEQIKALGASGDKLGAQKIILGELNKEFGGSAAAQATSADKMKVAFGNLQEQVGTALMPIITTLSDFLTTTVIPVFSLVTGALQDNWGWLKYVAIAAGTMWAAMQIKAGVTAGLELARNKLIALRGMALATGDSMVAGGRKAGGFFATYGKGLAVIGGTVAVAGLAGKALGDLVDEDSSFKMFDGLSDSLGKLQSSLVNTKGDTRDAAAQWAEAAVKAAGLDTKAAAAGITLDELTKAVMGGRDGAGQLAQKWRELGDPADSTLVKLGALGAGYEQTAAATRRNSEVTKTNADAHKGAADKTNEQRDALGRTTAEIKEQDTAAKKLTDTLKLLSGDKIGAAQAEIQFKNGLAEATQQVKDNGSSLSINTAKGRENRSWLLDQLSSLQSVASAQLEAGESTEVVTGKLHTNEAALRKAATAAGLNAGQVDALIGQYGQLPPVKATNVKSNAGSVAGKVQGLNNELGKVKPVIPASIDIQVNDGAWRAFLSSLNTAGSQLNTDYANKTRSFHGSTGRNAQGTGFWRGGVTSLSEMGQETVYLPRGTRVDTADTTLSRARMADGGGGQTVIQVNVPAGVTDPYNYGRDVAAGLTTYFSRGGSPAGLVRALGVG